MTTTRTTCSPPRVAACRGSPRCWPSASSPDSRSPAACLCRSTHTSSTSSGGLPTGLPSGLSDVLASGDLPAGFPGAGGAGGGGGTGGAGAGTGTSSAAVPVLVGTVTSIDGTTVRVEDLGGTVHAVTTTSDTTLARTGIKASAALTKGDTVTITGTKASDGAMSPRQGSPSGEAHRPIAPRPQLLEGPNHAIHHPTPPRPSRHGDRAPAGPVCMRRLLRWLRPELLERTNAHSESIRTGWPSRRVRPDDNPEGPGVSASRRYRGPVRNPVGHPVRIRPT